ncbi:MAG: MMPL family transporter [Chromatiales bacterium]|nr:RND family transporter [Gammaproteobacteria bacterium]
MSSSELNQTQARYFFRGVTAWPKTIIAIGLMFIIGFASFIPTLEKDTRADAFIPPDHPALLFRDKVEDIFGLQDPMVIALVNEGEAGIFNPHSLEVVEWLTRRLETVDNIDPERITSLATENDIIGTEDGMLVEPFFEIPPRTQAAANAIRTAVLDFPLYVGSLVSRDGTGTLIVAELDDQTNAQQVYEELLQIVEQAPVKEGEQLYVAGEGAVAGYMGAYIDADALRLNPIAGLVITLVCFVAFRTLRGTLIPNLVVAATAASALGLMAAAGVSFFVITNALPVVLIGIAVADSIHILSQYYEEVALHPDDTPRDVTLRTMLHMWRPVTLTSLTTMAGFLGLYFASMMPPMQYFGLFALTGVGVAWVYSLTVVPAVLSLLRLKPSRAYSIQAGENSSRVDGFGRVLDVLGRAVVRAPRRILLVAVTLIVIGGIGASKIQLDETLIRVFHHEEPLHIADTTLNRVFDGTHFLDIMIETPEPEDLFKPEHLQRIEALQRWLEIQPHVNGTTSIVDYPKQMNKALHEDSKEAYRLPEDPDLVAQYFLLYSASGDPTDFQEEVDYDYQLANVRARLDDGRYSVEKVVIEAAQQYIDDEFNAPGIKAYLSGRVNVDYHWIKRLGESHVVSVAISLLLVWLMATVSFRSAVAGTIALLPVVTTILTIYAVMGFSGIWLSIGTSMFAAISIGLGVDFSIHTIERLQSLLRDTRLSMDEAILKLYPSTGRALLFNFAALALGFGVLTTSKVVVLHEFGVLVAVAIATSFLFSMTVLPALVKVFKPGFLWQENAGTSTAIPQTQTTN